MPLPQALERSIDQTQTLVDHWNQHALGMPSNARSQLQLHWRAIRAHLMLQQHRLDAYEAQELSRKEEASADRSSVAAGEKVPTNGTGDVELPVCSNDPQ